MTADIKEMVSQCSICAEYQVKQQKEPLMICEIPARPWKTVAQDLFTHGKKDYLITVDYCSDFWELDCLPDTASNTIITCTKAHFARYGVPDTMVIDHGPQFRSHEYEKFAQQWEVVHTTSSPYHSQSNGKAESAVKIAKKLMSKAVKDHRDYLTVLDWRNTPTAGSQYSPVHELHSRETWTLLPTSEVLLLPAVATNVVDEIELKHQKAKVHYDRGAKPLPDLQIGQTVNLQPLDRGNTWKTATTVSKRGDCSYMLQTDEGYLYRRNRKFI